MFESTAAVDGDLALLAEVAEAARAENRAAYRKVAAAGEFYARWMDRELDGFGDPIPCGNAGLAEIALRLACSKTTAENYAELGLDLKQRLPRVRAAFADGAIDYAKALRISRSTDGYTDDVIARIEPELVAAATRLAPTPLATELDTLLIRVAPDQYAAMRAEEEKLGRRVRKRRIGFLDRVEADLDAAEATAVWQRIHEVAATVCAHDPRGKQYRLVDAYLALVHEIGRAHV